MIGWAAVTGDVSLASMLFLLIFSGRRRISGRWRCSSERRLRQGRRADDAGGARAGAFAKRRCWSMR